MMLATFEGGDDGAPASRALGPAALTREWRRR
jgi:hypothetical protein